MSETPRKSNLTRKGEKETDGGTEGSQETCGSVGDVIKVVVGCLWTGCRRGPPKSRSS